MFCAGAESRDRLDSPSDKESGKEFAAVLEIARDLSANSALVFLLVGGRLEVARDWIEPDDPTEPSMDAGDRPDPKAAGVEPGAQLRDALVSGGGANAGGVVANFLKSRYAPGSNSFLLFTRCVRKSAVIIAFGFAGGRAVHETVPPAIAERLSLVAFAAWSARQLDVLQAELKIANQKLANQKLVERAKALLQAELRVDEPQAYEHLRKTSRRRRITMAKVAEELLRRSRGNSP